MMTNSHLACTSLSIADALYEAEELCEKRGGNLTPLRRKALTLLLESTRPTKAYDLLRHLRDSGEAKPPTVYRTLDLLMQMGLIHKVESLGAFVACGHWRHGHAAVFLICSGCGLVSELHANESIKKLTQEVGSVKFKVRAAVIEVGGLCQACA